jgi:hypothetical protein
MVGVPRDSYVFLVSRREGGVLYINPITFQNGGPAVSVIAVRSISVTAGLPARCTV